MKHLLLAFVMFIFVANCSYAQITETKNIDTNNDEVTQQIEQQFYQALNDYRQSLNLVKINSNIDIAKVAEARVNELKLLDIKAIADDTILRKSVFAKGRKNREQKCIKIAHSLNFTPIYFNEICCLNAILVYSNNQSMLVKETVDAFLKSVINSSFKDILIMEYTENSMVGIKACLYDNKIIFSANFLGVLE